MSASSLACLALSLVACDGNVGPCGVNRCDCVDTSDCEFICVDEPCVGTCASLSTCGGQCGDRCELSCNSTSDCDLGCGDACVVDCRSVSTCAVTCGVDCQVDCTSLSTCRVVMISGLVRCESVSDCDASCALPDGTTQPAEDCGGGVFACGGCPG
ncbi:MAG: hypothetical protein AB7S26_18565 [Sandaracinaceae bacterium]